MHYRAGSYGKIDEDVKTRLRLPAAEHHRSMEEDVRIILRDTMNGAERTKAPQRLITTAPPSPRPSVVARSAPRSMQSAMPMPKSTVPRMLEETQGRAQERRGINWGLAET